MRGNRYASCSPPSFCPRGENRAPERATEEEASRAELEARLVALADFPHERRARRAARAERQDDLAAPGPSHFRVRPSEVTRRVEVQERRPTQPEDAESALRESRQRANLPKRVVKVAEIIRSRASHRPARADDSALPARSP